MRKSPAARLDRNCKRCGAGFSIRPSDVTKGRGNYCSRPCFVTALKGVPQPKLRSLEERFWEKVDRPSDAECWRWTGAITSTGYGHLLVDGKFRRATHVSWELHHGKPFPEGMVACHHCDNRPCVNPSHLFVGTQRDNILDMLAKGRDGASQKRHAVPARNAP